MMYTVYLKPNEEFYISFQVDAQSLEDAIAKARKLDVRKRLLGKGVEWIDGDLVVSGAVEN